MILFGAMFAYFDERKQYGSFISDAYFWHGIVFSTIFSAAVFYAALTYPDWMWMYFLEDSANSGLELLYLFVFLYYMPYVLGFLLGRELKKISTSLWIILIVSQLLAEIWLIAHLFNRYSVIGTRDQFLSGTATSLFGPDNPIALAMNGSVVLMVIYFIIIAYRYKKRRLPLS